MVLLFAVTAHIASAATPTESQSALYQALTPRHLERACTELATLSDTPAEDFVWLAENTERPAWVAIRSAECVLELYAEPAAPALTRWMQSQNTLGLALTTVHAMDGVPVSVARPVLEAGLAGPLADELRPRIQRLATPELRLLAGSSPSARP
jgi:hypothetical protein